MFEITIGQNPEPHSERPFIETLVGGQVVYADSNDAIIGEHGELIGGTVLVQGLKQAPWWHVASMGSDIIIRKIDAPDRIDSLCEKWGYYSDECDATCNSLHSNMTTEDMELKKFLSRQISESGIFHGGTEGYRYFDDSLTYVDTYKRLRAFNPKRSTKFPGKISLYPDLNKMVMGPERRVAYKVGRAFRLMFPELSDAQLEVIVDSFRHKLGETKMVIKSGTDRKDFEAAYNGQLGDSQNPDTMRNRKFLGNSCLRPNYLWSDDNQFRKELPHHPAQAYGSGDFTVFWAEDGNDRVLGRVVVLTTTEGEPRSGPVYGLSEQVLDALAAKVEALRSDSSWDCWGNDWEGARMLLIPFKGDVDYGYVAPYLDVEPTKLEPTGDKYLTITWSGSVCAGSYRGVLEGSHTNCDSCGDGMHEDESYFSDSNDSRYCESCFNDCHSECASDQCYYHTDHMTNVNFMCRWGVTTEWVADQNLGEYATGCTDGRYWREDDATFCEVEFDFISPPDLEAGYFMSDNDGEWYPNSMMVTVFDVDGNDSTQSREEVEDDTDYKLTDPNVYRWVNDKEEEGEV
tara:strand:- start:1085 stop:2800 length:1716 start_codon:yes stop_codon:yes gene_type:complete